MALAMALLFALISVWSTYAHACHGPGHGVAHESAAHQSNNDGASGVSHEHDRVPAPDHPASHKSTPSCCADLQCHGGIAIVHVGLAVVAPRYVPESFSISNQTHDGWRLASLDRPPRFSVQV